MWCAVNFPAYSTNSPFSRQIRAPIYSLKQSKLRKRRVVRFAVAYFAMFVLFLVVIIGPIIAGKHLNGIIGELAPSLGLAQPTGLNNNDTNYSQTGTGLKATATATATKAARFVLADW